MLVTSSGLQSYNAARFTLFTASGVASDITKILAIKGLSPKLIEIKIPTAGSNKSLAIDVKNVNLKLLILNPTFAR